MNTIPLNSKFLKELLNKSNFTARLFTNDLAHCEDIPSAIQFEQASFNGYSSKFLNPMLWVAENQSVSAYIKYKYSSGIVWKNWGPGTSEAIRGYYITDQDNNLLWFEKFNSEITLAKNEAMLVNIEIEMNDYDFPQTTITLIIKNNNNIIPANTSIDIQNIKWGGVDYPPDYFIDLLDRNFIPQNNIVCIGVKDKIKPCNEQSLQFDLTVSSSGFQTYQDNILVNSNGNTIIEINLLEAATTTTTIDPNLPPAIIQGILSIEVANDMYDINTSSTLDMITIKAYKPIVDKFPDIIVNNISFELSGNPIVISDNSLPDQLKNSENFTKMIGVFTFANGDLGKFTITNTTTIPAQDGNRTFFSGTMDEDSALGKWVLGDLFSAELTFKNSDLLKTTNSETGSTTYYLYLKNFSFTVSGNKYYSNPLI